MPDPINPKLSGPDLLELISQQNPHLTRDELLAIAASAGFDLMDLRRKRQRPALHDATRRRQPAEKTRARQ